MPMPGEVPDSAHIITGPGLETMTPEAWKLVQQMLGGLGLTVSRAKLVMHEQNGGEPELEMSESSWVSVAEFRELLENSGHNYSRHRVSRVASTLIHQAADIVPEQYPGLVRLRPIPHTDQAERVISLSLLDAYLPHIKTRGMYGLSEWSFRVLRDALDANQSEQLEAKG